MPNLNVGLSLASLVGTTDVAAMVSCEATMTPGLYEGGGLMVSDDYACVEGTTYYYNGYGVTECRACEGDFELTELEADIPGCFTMTYQGCAEGCAKCDDCVSDTSWSAAGAGYEKKVTRTCDCGYCDETASYRCAANYYGSSSNGTSGCTACPSYNGIAGTSSAGSTSASACCISSGATYSFSDTAGSGTAKISSTCCAG